MCEDMPSKKDYDLVNDDGFDMRIPMHSEDAFQHGIYFQAKFVGALEVPRPTSRIEIVSAMRRIRYEFKAKAVKKRKVDVCVSLEGVRVSLKRKKKQQWYYDDNRLTLMAHPVYRIFYVSHDSQDLKIFSYIAREPHSNVFRCNVYKAYKKSEAMRIVRTIGQAFEVCHKVNSRQNTLDGGDDISQQADALSVSEKVMPGSDSKSDKEPSINKEESISSPAPPVKSSASIGQSSNMSLAASTTGGALSSSYFETEGSSMTSSSLPPHQLSGSIGTTYSLNQSHRLQLLQSQLELQQQQTQAALAQVNLLRDQLAAETTARVEAQTRTDQLLTQNRELIQQMFGLVSRLQEVEHGTQSTVNSNTILNSLTSGTNGSVNHRINLNSVQFTMARDNDEVFEGNPVIDTLSNVPSAVIINPSSSFIRESLSSDGTPVNGTPNHTNGDSKLLNGHYEIPVFKGSVSQGNISNTPSPVSSTLHVLPPGTSTTDADGYSKDWLNCLADLKTDTSDANKDNGLKPDASSLSNPFCWTNTAASKLPISAATSSQATPQQPLKGVNESSFTPRLNPPPQSQQRRHHTGHHHRGGQQATSPLNRNVIDDRNLDTASPSIDSVSDISDIFDPLSGRQQSGGRKLTNTTSFDDKSPASSRIGLGMRMSKTDSNVQQSLFSTQQNQQHSVDREMEARLASSVTSDLGSSNISQSQSYSSHCSGTAVPPIAENPTRYSVVENKESKQSSNKCGPISSETAANKGQILASSDSVERPQSAGSTLATLDNMSIGEFEGLDS